MYVFIVFAGGDGFDDEVLAFFFGETSAHGDDELIFVGFRLLAVHVVEERNYAVGDDVANVILVFMFFELVRDHLAWAVDVPCVDVKVVAESSIKGFIDELHIAHMEGGSDVLGL